MASGVGRGPFQQVAITGLEWRAALEKQSVRRRYGALVIVLLFLSSARVPQYALNYSCAFVQSVLSKSASIQYPTCCFTQYAKCALKFCTFPLKKQCARRMNHNLDTKESIEHISRHIIA
jgi:hypothetical protein